MPPDSLYSYRLPPRALVIALFLPVDGPLGRLFLCSALARRLDLPGVLAQLRRDPWQIYRGEDRLLGLPGHALLAQEHAVLVELQPARLRKLADRDVVRLGAREVVERRAEALRGNDPQVDLQSALEHHRGPRGAGRAHLLHLRIGSEALHDRRRRRRGDDDIEIADRLAAPAITAREHDLLDARNLAQMRSQRLGVLRCFGERKPALLRQARGHRFEHPRLGLLAEPLELAKPALPCRIRQILEALDLQLPVERSDPLGAEPGKAEEIRDPVRVP